MKNFNKHIYNLCHNYQYKLHALTRAYSLTITIWHHLFLKFWLANTWFFAHWHHQSVVNRLEDVRQLNIKRGQKLDFQLSHRQPLSHEIYHSLRKRLDIQYFIYRRSILLKTFDYYSKNIHHLLILEMLIH